MKSTDFVDGVQVLEAVFEVIGDSCELLEGVDVVLEVPGVHLEAFGKGGVFGLDEGEGVADEEVFDFACAD